MSLQRSRSFLGTWAEFLAWVLFGAIATVGLLTFGTFAALPILVVVLLAVTRPTLRGSWFGVLAGAGAISLLIAFTNRRGPGMVCWQTATAAGCDQHLNPWPWAIVGAGLVVAGLLAQARRLRSDS